MIQRAAVLGAGTMGAQIAAHLANADVPVLLLDVSEDAAAAGLARALQQTPDPFFLRDSPDGSSGPALIRTGSFDTGLAEAGTADWIVEAIVENLDAKRALLSRLVPHLSPYAIVSSNTSGIPIADIAAGLGPAAGRFLGTHFFNPPRYLPLVEVVPSLDTAPDVVAVVRVFLDRRLGKGVVLASDEPGFIANRIGIHAFARVLEVVAEGRYSIAEADALTGRIIGRPKTAAFGTADLVGLDLLSRVAQDLRTRLRDDAFELPTFVGLMLDAGATGNKAGRGFYKMVTGDHGDELLVRAGNGEYVRPDTSGLLSSPSLAAARGIDDLDERLRVLFTADDRAGAFLRATLGPTLLYAARVAPDIAHAIDDVDRAMCWGFAWERGPFEVWDAIGIRSVLDLLEVAEEDIPPLVAITLADGRDRFRDGRVSAAHPDFHLLRDAPILRANRAGSLVDLGDGVFAVNLRLKMNTIDGATLEMLDAGLAAAAEGAGLVIGTEEQHFSTGVNLALLLEAATEGRWEDIDRLVRAFQQATSMLRHAPVPVVVATAGRALGGGCEIALHADRVQAAAESYLGLVETGVGLIPAGGGTKEMLARAMETRGAPPADLLPEVQRVFETLAFGRVSTSAPHARQLGYLRDVDGITMHRNRVVADARRLVLVRAGSYHPRRPRARIPVGGPAVFEALVGSVELAQRAGRISSHDVLVARQLARVLTGGDVPQQTTLSEQQLLDLEREAFLRLVGEPKTIARIAHTLETGKALRN